MKQTTPAVRTRHRVVHAPRCCVSHANPHLCNIHSTERLQEQRTRHVPYARGLLSRREGRYMRDNQLVLRRCYSLSPSSIDGQHGASCTAVLQPSVEPRDPVLDGSRAATQKRTLGYDARHGYPAVAPCCGTSARETLRRVLRGLSCEAGWCCRILMALLLWSYIDAVSSGKVCDANSRNDDDCNIKMEAQPRSQLEMQVNWTVNPSVNYAS